MLSRLKHLSESIVPIRSSGNDFAPPLLDQNLISGVVNAVLDDEALVDE
jgi:hypothetical protein